MRIRVLAVPSGRFSSVATFVGQIFAKGEVKPDVEQPGGPLAIRNMVGGMHAGSLPQVLDCCQETGHLRHRGQVQVAVDAAPAQLVEDTSG